LPLLLTAESGDDAEVFGTVTIPVRFQGSSGVGTPSTFFAKSQSLQTARSAAEAHWSRAPNSPH